MTPIIDAQVHAWRAGESTGHHRRAPITGAVLADEMSRASVSRAVLVPPLWDPEGNAYSLELAQAEPDRFAVMGLVAANDPGATVEAFARTPGMKGARFLFNTPERLAPFRAGAFDAAWAAAERHALPVAILAPGALDAVGAIASRHPALRIIVDHLGVPRGAKGPNAFAHLPSLLALAAHPNVSVKAAGVGDYAEDSFPFASLAEPLRRVFDAFGAGRVIWASDLSRLQHGYRQCVEHFVEHLPWLYNDELALVMGGNIARLLRWA